jgi:hypothetical protein
MATDRSLEPPGTIEHRTSRLGRWLRARRLSIALWIAVIEGIIVAFSEDFSRWTVVAIAIVFLALYVVWGRNLRSDAARQLFWIAGFSQALAVVVVILSFFLVWISLIVAAVFAGIALLYLLTDRG